jgi:stage III sporulation protein AH
MDTIDEEKLMSSDSMVMGTEPVSAENADTRSEYFAAVRLSRQEARDNAVTLLQEAMAYSEDPQAAQTNAELEKIVQTALCEAQIESLVIAKGYADCVAYISDSGISVAVASPEGGIDKNDVAVIADIVLTQSDFGLEDIHVVEVP